MNLKQAKEHLEEVRKAVLADLLEKAEAHLAFADTRHQRHGNSEDYREVEGWSLAITWLKEEARNEGWSVEKLQAEIEEYIKEQDEIEAQS